MMNSEKILDLQNSSKILDPKMLGSPTGNIPYEQSAEKSTKLEVDKSSIRRMASLGVK